VSTWWTLSLLQKAEPCQPVRQRQADGLGPARLRLGLCGDPGVESVKDWTRDTGGHDIGVDPWPTTARFFIDMN